MLSYENCRLCPRACGVDRTSGALGFCRESAELKVAKAMIHEGEEPCLIGRTGAGAVFFSGCNLRCVFCQNEAISSRGFGKVISEERLGEIFLELQEKGAVCLDLVTPTHYVLSVARVLQKVKPLLRIPVVYNCGGYENGEALKMLEGLVDVYLPDLKYYDPDLSERYSHCRDYFEKAWPALKEMVRQTGPCRFSPEGQLMQGVLVRHLVLPGASHDSEKLMDLLGREFPKDTVYVSIMRQYTPYASVKNYPEINRKITGLEYERVVTRALQNGLPGFRQAKTASTMQLLPHFDLEGV